MYGGTQADTSRRRECEAQTEALGHPLKALILAALAERPGVSIREVARRLGEPERRVRHQMEKLTDAGLVEVTGEASRRGVIERRYAARYSTLLEGDDPEIRLSYAITTIKMLFASVAASAAEGAFGSARDFVVRDFGEVDDASLQKVYEIHDRAFREISEAMAAGRQRIRESGEEGTPVVSALLLFEAALWGRPEADTDAP